MSISKSAFEIRYQNITLNMNSALLAHGPPASSAVPVACYVFSYS